MRFKNYIRLIAIGSLAVWNVACSGGGEAEEKATSESTDPKVAKLKLQTGFHVEHLYGPSENGNGSWVSLAFDDKGRLIASDQYGAMYRMEIPKIGSDTSEKVKIEKLVFDSEKVRNVDGTKPKVEMGYAQGLVWAFNSLYIVVNHKGDSNFAKTSGFYRLQDTDNDDQFDKITLLQSLVGHEEHGPHSVKLAPDGKSFYVIAGNVTKMPPMTGYRLPENQIGIWDNLLPVPATMNEGTQPSGGWIAKVDSTGTKWQLIAAGLRNPFDLAFNKAGDLFAYDSDMEWDIGMPWYRPTRICHVPSGAEFGFRELNAKWPPSYIDNLPPVLNIGQGSPTNLVSLDNARFPSCYGQSLLAFDWSFGIIYAVHLEPDGASYKAKAEEFLSGAPLPLTDGVVGPDGALYFATGGRRLESNVYRVYYGDKGDGPLASSEDKATGENDAGKIRRELEQFHGGPNPAAIKTTWPYLKSDDRFIRYAARIAIEHQPVEQWQQLALQEKDPVTLIQAMVALARQGKKTVKPALLETLMSVDYAALSVSQQQDLLRAFELCFCRMGKPAPGHLAGVSKYLNAQYPAGSNELNRMLCKILVYIDDDQVVPKTLALLETATDDSTALQTVSNSSDLILRNPMYGMDIANILTNVPPSQQIYYAIVLSEAKKGWTTELQEKYFKWFYKAYGYKAGRHYFNYMDNARTAALKNVQKDRFKYYDSLSTNKVPVESNIDWVKIMSDGGPGRNWKVPEALKVVENKLIDRDFEQGKLMFTGTACSTCHGMRGEGGGIGPDLTQLGTRFSEKDILESIIEPNKSISDQYASTMFYMKDGTTVLGKLIREDKDKYFVSQNPFAPASLRELAKKDVSANKTADVSVMPPGLINSLNEERLKDLMAYLISGGNIAHPAFKKQQK